MLTAYAYCTARIIDSAGITCWLVKEARAVKLLKGALNFARNMEAIAKASTPVVGHLGLMPQSINKTGEYRDQCKEYESAKKLVDDALAVQKAGAVALVLECGDFRPKFVRTYENICLAMK